MQKTAIPTQRHAPAPTSASASVSTAARRTGLGLMGFIGLFLLFDGGARAVGFGPYVEGTTQFGYPVEYAPWIGLTLIISTLLYLIPRTAVLGAILVTGYLGGAAAAQVRAQDPWFLFPVTFGVLAWAALYLLDPRLRVLLPLRQPAPPTLP